MKRGSKPILKVDIKLANILHNEVRFIEEKFQRGLTQREKFYVEILNLN